MSDDPWLDVIQRICVLPEVLRPGAAGEDRSGTFALRGTAGAPPVPSPRLWARTEDAPAAVGIMVRNMLDDPANLALHLAAVAIERRIMPVILSTCDVTGLEPYGLRIERVTVTAGEPDPVELAELRAYWDIVVVIEAADIGALG